MGQCAVAVELRVRIRVRQPHRRKLVRSGVCRDCSRSGLDLHLNVFKTEEENAIKL